LIVAGVLAYYGIFAPAGFLGPTARGFGQVQVLNPWSLSATTGAMTLNIENRVGGTISINNITYTISQTTYFDETPACTGCIVTSTNITSGNKAVYLATPTMGPTGVNVGDSYSATVTIFYEYQGGQFSSTGTLSGTYS